ncbi:hypothetical protein ACGFYF_23615 [Streptomyces lavendulae]
MPRTVEVAAGAGVGGLAVRVRLRGEAVIWSGLMFPGLGGGVVGEVRFRVGRYLGEVELAYAAALK